MTSGYKIGEFEEDGALDELYALIDWLVQRIEHSLSFPGFYGVDVSAVRANIAMLATVIGQHGGAHLIKKSRVQEWSRRIDEPFAVGSMGFHALAGRGKGRVAGSLPANRPKACRRFGRIA
jgi:hypothetical protein